MRSSLVMNRSCCQNRAPLSTDMPGNPHPVRENRLMRRSVRRVVGLGIVAGIGYAVWRKVAPANPSSRVGWEPQPFPFPPQPSATPSEPQAVWVDAEADGECPATHPVKAKLASGIFHVPGGTNYARTRADRCYTSAEAAEADGLRASKR